MYAKNHVISLISFTETQDKDGFPVRTETSISVYASIDSITGAEFYQTGLLNIQPSFRAVIWAHEYAGQTVVEYKNKRYGVYRTFLRNRGEIELYLEEKAGEC